MAVQAADVDVVKVEFANSCSQEVQEDFSHAMTLLHSFEYPETGKIFGEIIDQDPGCAMARWGAAMSIWHPLWAPPSKEELDKGARILAETENLRLTEREAAYIGAANAFFSSVEEALRLAQAAADREDGVDKNPVTPGEVLPARELYADMLFESSMDCRSPGVTHYL